MAIDDLRGVDALRSGYRSGSLSIVSGRRTLAATIICSACGVVHHRAQGLTELMGNRAGQRRHRLAATGVGGERQVPPAVDLGPLPCAALVQEPDDQERLDDQRADRAQHRAPVFAATGSDRDSARRCRPATDSRGCPIAAARASRISADLADCGGTLMLRGGAPFKMSMADVGRVATEVVDGHQPFRRQFHGRGHAVRPKQGSIRRGVKVGEHPLVRIRPALRVGAEGEIEDRRVGSAGSQQRRKISGRDRSSDQTNVSRSRNRLNWLLELTTPEFAERSGAHHHEYLPGLGQHLQDVVDESGKIVDDRDRGFVLAKWRVAADIADRRRRTAAAFRERAAADTCARIPPPGRRPSR